MDRECQSKQPGLQINNDYNRNNNKQFPVQPQQFSFNCVTYKKTNKVLRNLDTKKYPQDAYIPTRITEENFDLFAHFLMKVYNNMIIKSEFPQTLNNSNVTPVDKKTHEMMKLITGP